MTTPPDRLEQIRARLEQVNDKLLKREYLHDNDPAWRAYTENAPFDLAEVLSELDASRARERRLEELIAAWREHARRVRPLETSWNTAEKRKRVEEWMMYTNRANEVEAALQSDPVPSPLSPERTL